MNITVHKEKDPLLLKHVLLIYENDTEKLLQRGTVEVVNEQPVITRLNNITESLASLLLNEKRSPLTFIPEPVVGVTRDACAWYLPAQERPLLFSPTRDVTLADLNGQHFPQPPLLMISNRHSLRVYALQDNTRPTPSTILMNAPYYNIFDNDSVCMGTAYRPFDGTVAHLHEWEASFFGSRFTHRADSKTRWITDRTHRELWEGARDAGRFDPAWLISSGQTLQSALGNPL